MPTLENFNGASLVANPAANLARGMSFNSQLQGQQIQDQATLNKMQLAQKANSRIEQQQVAKNQMLTGNNPQAKADYAIQYPEDAKAIADAQKAQFEAAEAPVKARVSSVVNFAAQLKGKSPDAQIRMLTERKNQLSQQGLPTNDTDEHIALIQSGDVEGANAAVDSAIQLGERLNILQPVVDPEVANNFKQEELDIKRDTLLVRQEEQRQRAYDRAINSETNSIKREELRMKLEESRAKSEQAVRSLDFEADNAINGVGETIATVDRLLAGDGLESAAGASNMFPTIAGSKAANFEATLETLQSQAFLSQVQKMKGMGALSENEGKKLGSAIGALNLSMSDKALRAELGRIRDTLNKSQERLRIKFNKPAQTEAKQADLSTLSDEELMKGLE